jgi:SpoVK/Ycf46/Vps4 family AAA+-type ATPase
VSALVLGAAGAGKSTAAGIVAAELGRELHRVDLARADLPDLLEAAEDGETILLFDDADRLLAGRDPQVAELARLLDRFEGVAIFTSRLAPATIDRSIARRLSLQLSFPLPDEDAREQIWRIHLGPDVPTAGAIDLRVLARRYSLSGGAIRAVVVRAAFLAAEESASVSLAHLERAIAQAET